MFNRAEMSDSTGDLRALLRPIQRGPKVSLEAPLTEQRSDENAQRSWFGAVLDTDTPRDRYGVP